MRQSDRLPAYRTALEQLWRTRPALSLHLHPRDIARQRLAPRRKARRARARRPVYPGTCRAGRAMADRPPATQPAARHGQRARASVAMPCASSKPARPIGGQHDDRPPSILMQTTSATSCWPGRDMGTSYHLSVVLDDAARDHPCGPRRGSVRGHAHPRASCNACWACRHRSITTTA